MQTIRQLKYGTVKHFSPNISEQSINTLTCSMASRVSKQDTIVSIGGWKEDARDVLLLFPPFFHFPPVFGKNGQNNRLAPPPLSSVQTTRKRTLKQNFSLMFAVYPLIFSICSLISFAFTFAFTRCKGSLGVWEVMVPPPVSQYKRQD